MTREYIENGLTHLLLENDSVLLIILPEIGGKIIKLENKFSGSNLLLTPGQNPVSYEKAFYGADYSKFDPSGFDECLPTISACSFEVNEKNFIYPDHGELWSREWKYKLTEDEIVLEIPGVAFHYKFEKRIRLDGEKIIISYLINNYSEDTFYFLWAAHPLLAVEPEDRIIFPDSVQKMFLNWSSDDKIGSHADLLNWPCLTGSKRKDFSIVQKINYDKAVKLFTEKLEEGKASVLFKATGEELVFKFDVNKIPYMGLWLCYGGWPVDSEKKYLTVAIEPSIGRPDSLAEAISRNEAGVVQGKSQMSWELILELINH